MTVTLQFLRLQRTALLVWGTILVLMVFGVTSATPAVTGKGVYIADGRAGAAPSQAEREPLRRAESAKPGGDA